MFNRFPPHRSGSRITPVLEASASFSFSVWFSGRILLGFSLPFFQKHEFSCECVNIFLNCVMFLKYMWFFQIHEHFLNLSTFTQNL